MNMLLDNWIKFLDKHVWIKRIGVYASIFVGITVAFIFIFGLFKLIIPDFSIVNNTVFTQYNATELRSMGFFDNERYLVSALVQSLAATIALVITLSLVAVQLAAQSYSARVIDVYKNNPDMWILLSIYIAVIFYGLGLLKVIDIGIAGINMEFAIFAAYFLGFFAFVCLVPYIWSTLELLKPSPLIDLIATNISTEKYPAAFNDNLENPFQPIIDIINSSLEKNDSETSINGLKAIENKYKKIILINGPTNDDKIRFSNDIFRKIKKIGDSAIYKRNDDTLLSTISVLKNCGIIAAKHNLESAAESSAESIGFLGFETTVKKMDICTLETIESIKHIEDLLIENHFKMEAIRVNFIFGVLIKEAVFNKCGFAQYTIHLLEEVGLKAIEDKLEQNFLIVNPILNYLEQIINYAEKNDDKNIEQEAKDSYHSLKTKEN